MRVLIAYDGSPSANEACDLVAAAAWPPAAELRLVAAYHLYLPETYFQGGVVGDFDRRRRLPVGTGGCRGASRRCRLEAGTPGVHHHPGRRCRPTSHRDRRGSLDMGGRCGGGGQSGPRLVRLAAGLGLRRARRPCSVSGAGGPRARPSPGSSWPTTARLTLTWRLRSSPGPSSAPARCGWSACPRRRATRMVRRVAPWPLHRATLERSSSRVVARGRTVSPGPRPSDCAARGSAWRARCVKAMPPRKIVVAAVEHQASLIVMGTRGLTGFRRLMLGSVARDVLLHAHCSVLVTR